MRALLTALAITLVALSTGLTVAASPVKSAPSLPPQTEIHNREIIVEFDAAKAGKSVSALCTQHGVAQVHTMPLSYTTYQVVRVPDGEDYAAAYKALQNDPAVKSLGPNVIKHVSAVTPNDPLFLNGAADLVQGLESPYVKNDQWGLLITGAPEAWDTTTGSPSIVVAVLDTGANFNHEDIAHRYWINTGEIANNSLDDDSNGFVDDYRGYDFSGWANNAHTGGDADPSDPSGQPLSHGMCTASIIGAEGGNGIGITGVAGGTTQAGGIRVMVLRVGTEAVISVDAEIGAIDYAIENGARVISMSFGGASGGDPEENAIDRAWNAGVLPIAAAGNIGQGNEDGQGNPLVDLPAGFTNCMAVGATTVFSTQTVGGSTQIISETVAGYSKTGPELDIAAPGTHILGALNSTTGYTNSGQQFTGTSAATPVVAGMAGLLLSADPSLTVTELRNLIQTTAVDLGTAGVDDVYGHGRINMQAAMAQVAPVKIGDANGDGAVDNSDVQPIMDRFGARTGTQYYDAKVDTNNDGVIDELDLFAIGRNFGS